MSERQREAYCLYLDGLTVKEIAEKLGISYHGAKERLRNAELRKSFEKQLTEEKDSQTLIDLPLTKGEVKTIIESLETYRRELEKGVPKIGGMDDYYGKLPFEHQ